jgi:serpin B
MKSLSGFCIFAVLFGFSFISCSKWDRKSPIDRQDIVLTKAQQEVLDSSQVFAIDFFKEMCRELEKGNLFISPLSASMALSAVTNGGAGTTMEGMKATLGFGNFSLEQMNDFYKMLVPALKKADNTVDLLVANAAWIEQTFPVKESFTNSLQDYYDASINKLDFNDPKSPDVINAWCSENTKGMIKEIIDRIDPAYRLFYTNALYFKGDWKSTFDKKDSRKGPFQNASGHTSQIVFMEQTQTLRYYTNKKVALAELPYGNEAFSMVVALPAEGMSAEDLALSLDIATWNDWMESLYPATLHVRMPRFELAFDTEDMMIPVLARMGMGIAFDPLMADFSHISDIPLFIGMVKQSTRIQVDEKGTEAAAVTIIGFELTSAGPDPQPIPFHVDRPFLLFIKEKSTGTILFSGLIKDL